MRTVALSATSVGLGAVLLVAVAGLLASAGLAVADTDTQFVSQGRELTLAAGPSQYVVGETPLDPGTELTVQVESAARRGQVSRSRNAVVRPDGVFGTEFDLTDVSPDTRVIVSVLHDGRLVALTTGRVVECDGECAPAEKDPTGGDDESPLRGTPSVAPVTQITQGETMQIPVSLGNASAVTLTVGGPPFNYEINATLRDGNDDGRVDVLFRSAAAGTPRATISPVYAADQVTIVGTETPLTDPLDPADYDLTLINGTDPGDRAVDAGSLVVHESGWRPPPENGAQPTTENPPFHGGPTGVLGSIPLNAVGSLSVGAGLALLALRVIFTAARR